MTHHAAPAPKGGRTRKTRRRNIRRRTQRARGKRARGGVVRPKPNNQVIPSLEQLRQKRQALTFEIWELEHKPNQNAEDVARINEAEKEMDDIDNRIANHPEMLAVEAPDNRLRDPNQDD